MNKKRIYGLDILRAVAVLDITYAHSWERFGNSVTYSLFDAVNLFFVLSGFLIGQILIKLFLNEVKWVELVDFWVRRWMRTLPAFMFVLTLIFIYHRYKDGMSLKDYLGYCFFLKSFFVARSTSIYPESWSLCIEEWFYISVPLMLFVLRKTIKLNVRYTFLAVILLFIIGDTILRLRVANFTSDFDNWNTHQRQGTIYRLDSIMFGLLAAYINFVNLFRRKKLMFFIGLIIWMISYLSFVIPYNQFFNYTFLSLQCIATFCVIPLLNDLKEGKGAVFNFITFISTISYSMYLLNLTPFILITQKISNKPLLIVGDIAFTIAGGYCMYNLIEKPFMNLRKSFSIISSIKTDLVVK